MNKMIVFLKEHWLTVVGAVSGIVGGYLYYRFVGCTSGSCPITSSPWISSIWGGMMGGLFLNVFEKKPVKKQDHEG